MKPNSARGGFIVRVLTRQLQRNRPPKCWSVLAGHDRLEDRGRTLLFSLALEFRGSPLTLLWRNWRFMSFRPRAHALMLFRRRILLSHSALLRNSQAAN